MMSYEKKKIKMVENMDLISQMPEPIILDIITRLPFEDYGRASILSKTWKSFCSLYPILHFDHHIFALQSLASAKQGGQEPDSNQIRDMFMSYVDCHLTRASKLNIPIRKSSLTLVIKDSMYFSRVDAWLELVRKADVEGFHISVQTLDCHSDDYISDRGVCYEFPLSVLALKNLRYLHVQGFKLGFTTFVGDASNKSGISYVFLKELCLSQVFIDEYVLGNLISCCQGIETLVLDKCTTDLKFLELSKFPKLKKALIELQDDLIAVSWLENVDIVDTNLEYFKCDVDAEFHTSTSACAGIRELTLVCCTINQPYLLEDLTATFPLLEEAEFAIYDTDTLKADNNVLRKLKFYSHGLSGVYVKKVHIDCPSLTLLEFWTCGLTELYVDCPKLMQFQYSGSVPESLFFGSTAHLEESSCDISITEAYNTSSFRNLRAFLVHVIGSTTYISLQFALPVIKFEPEAIEAIQASPRCKVHLTLGLTHNNMQNVAALLDGVLWIIRPTTFTVNCKYFHLLKYMCDNLMRKSQENISDEQVPCWIHQLLDFQIECSADIPNEMKNLASLPELCRTITNQSYQTNQVHFKFQWSYS